MTAVAGPQYPMFCWLSNWFTSGKKSTLCFERSSRIADSGAVNATSGAAEGWAGG
jgi:hypothetical protein